MPALGAPVFTVPEVVGIAHARPVRLAKYLRAIGELYDVNPIKMLRGPDEFGLEIASPERFHRAEENSPPTGAAGSRTSSRSQAWFAAMWSAAVFKWST